MLDILLMGSGQIIFSRLVSVFWKLGAIKVKRSWSFGFLIDENVINFQTTYEFTQTNLT